MSRAHVMSLDVHCQSCQFTALTAAGRVRDRRSIPTAIPELTEAIRSVRRPRVLVFEEGPLADWLYRNLRPHVDRLIVCDPRRNHLIAADGDKDDPIDADKLAELAYGGYLREVHHPLSESRAVFKRQVALYHDRVRQKVRSALQVIWYLRGWGIIVLEKDFADDATHDQLLSRLPSRRTIRHHVEVLLEAYDCAAGLSSQVQQRLVRMAKQIRQIVRFKQLPGIAWVWGSTFYAYVDTPWRFRSKQALWKYMGIGLERRRSGQGVTRLGVPKRCNFLLKNTILSAARSAVAAGNNPFADQYERWLHDGRSPRIAVRNTARSLSAVMRGMWKNQTDYRPEWVGRPAHELVVRP